MSSPDFEAIKHLNPYNVEYWEARELQPLLGYKSWREFEGAIERAKTSCEATGNIVDDHFVSGYKLIEAGKGAKRPITDYTLSRLACYLIAMNGNPRLPQIAEAQQYFAVSTRKNEMHELRQAHQERIQIRLEVAEGNKQLSEAAAEAGVRSQMFGVFHDAGYLGQYALDSENIRIYKGIPEGGEILDYMGREELASNLLRKADCAGSRSWGKTPPSRRILPWGARFARRSSDWERRCLKIFRPLILFVWSWKGSGVPGRNYNARKSNRRDRNPCYKAHLSV